MMRQYTPKEIETLRACCTTKYLHGIYDWRRVRGMSRAYRDTDKAIIVEEMVRTHMLAGHTAEDLIASEREQT